MKRYMIASVLALCGLLFATSGEAGSFTSQSRSITAPSGFVPACKRYAWLCSGTKTGRAMSDGEALDVLRKVNGIVNSRVRAVSDRSNSGRSEDWTLPLNGRGDCEDFVLAKKKLLLDKGFRSDRLAVTVVLDRRGNNHAVLIARLESGDYVLDNLSGSVKSWNSTGYTYLARQSFENKRVWKVILSGPRAKQFTDA